MPKNPVSDPITNQEIAFAHLILGGTMNDRRAAKAVGLNPDTAANTKAKPRVRDYMIDHRAAVEEKLVDQEVDLSRRAVDLSRRAVDLSRRAVDLSRRAVEGLHQRNLGRDQILTRLWELANLNPEATRGSITGQVKALSMIIAIEGLIPDRRLGQSQAQSAAQPVQSRGQQQNQTEGTHPCDAPCDAPRDTVTTVPPNNTPRETAAKAGKGQILSNFMKYPSSLHADQGSGRYR
jgi:hypothetical protein